MSDKEKIRTVVHLQVDAWVDSLGDAITVEYARKIMKHCLRLCDAMIRLSEKLSGGKK